MAFIKLSRDFKKNSFVNLDSNFITDFLPDASEKSIKVYLLGLYYSTLDNDVNTIDNFCESLNLSFKDVEKAFKYWEDEGLVKISDLENMEIIYFPIDSKTAKFKPIDEGKYGDFYVLCQNVVAHELTSNEFKAYVDLIEKTKIEPEALLMIIKYATNGKEEKASANYILSIAKAWIEEKVFTVNAVEEKIKEMELTQEKIANLFCILGLKRNATIDERDMYIKWTKVFHYSDSTILDVAETLKKKGGMKALDNKISKYHSMQFFDFDEIQVYEKNKKHLTTLAKDVCTKLGLFVENLEPVVDNYLNNWLYKGYSDETLKLLATYCFKSDNKSLESMDIVIQKLYKQGIVSIEAFNQYMNELNATDLNIRNILDALNMARNVTQRDRELYNIWLLEWHTPKEVLDYAIELSKDKLSPFAYLTKIMSLLHENNVKTIDEAKSLNLEEKANGNNNSNKKQKLNMNTRSYTDEELNRLFDNLKEIDF